MTTIIEQDGIRIEAETEREAMKLLKRAQHKAREEREQHKRNEHQAELIAMSRGFRVMERIMELKSIPGGWGLYRNLSSVHVTCLRHGVYSITVRDNGHTAERELHCKGVDGVLENGAGEPMIIWVLESIGEMPRPYCVAAYENAVGMVPMPALQIQPDVFEKPVRPGCPAVV